MTMNKVGVSPGALVHLGDGGQSKCQVTKIEYNANTFKKETNINPDSITVEDKSVFHWVHVEGVHDAGVIQAIGKVFNLHNLVLEDVMNTKHRPKAENNETSLFFTFKLYSFDLSEMLSHSDQMSLVLGDNWVISFVEEKTKLFDLILSNLESGKGQVKSKPVDYLFYRLIDTVVDHYFVFKEGYSDAIDQLEEEVMDRPRKSSMEQNRKLKRKLLSFRKSVNASREAVTNLLMFESPLLSKDTLRYFRDVKDHLIYVSESVEGYRETLASITDLYHSSLGQQTNQVMQVLTIISTIFIPLTFIAGIYGMNFENIPELKFTNGYYYTWGVMVVITLGMLVYFKRKRWL